MSSRYVVSGSHMLYKVPTSKGLGTKVTYSLSQCPPDVVLYRSPMPFLTHITSFPSQPFRNNLNFHSVTMDENSRGSIVGT